jgi:hypothetical protein
MRNVADRIGRENKTDILCAITFFRKSSLLRDNVEQYGIARGATSDNIIWRMHFACSITKATETHSEYVILVTFPSQQWLREGASMLTFVSTLPVLHS